MKKGLSGTGISVINFGNIIDFAFRSLSSWMVCAGVLVYVISFVLWMVIIYRIDLSIAMPVGSASYVFIPILAIIFLHEHISFLRWLGIGMLVLGIYFVSKSKKEAGAICQS
ncbi:MAG: EamA family transporter [Candidatus Omnitrophica bacterium]|nr:EamA family transporter [Candidatus Omnitrophota bacterium]